MTNNIKFQHATNDDAQLLLDWRNDPITCKNSIDKNPVKKEDHLLWLGNTLNSKTRELYLAFVDGNAIGTVRFDHLEGTLWELSWTVAPEARGKGHGKEMVKQATFLRKENLLATIIKTNVASMKIAEYAGFKLASESSNGIIKLKLTKNNKENS